MSLSDYRIDRSIMLNDYNIDGIFILIGFVALVILFGALMYFLMNRETILGSSGIVVVETEPENVPVYVPETTDDTVEEEYPMEEARSEEETDEEEVEETDSPAIDVVETYTLLDNVIVVIRWNEDTWESLRIENNLDEPVTIWFDEQNISGSETSLPDKVDLPANGQVTFGIEFMPEDFTIKAETETEEEEVDVCRP